MSDSLYYFKPGVMRDMDFTGFPGLATFSNYPKLYAAGSVPFDRTGTIKTPFKSGHRFLIPSLRPMKKTFEEICNERANELLARADRFDVRIYTLWSGGIDSTLALVSLLKNANAAQRKRITVLMSLESIRENGLFYENFIKGKLRTETSSSLPLVLGTRNILVSGEHNDQLFGSDLMAPLIVTHGPGIIRQKYDPTILIDHYAKSFEGDKKLAEFYVRLFEKLPPVCPIPIETMFEFTWWINFSLKWATVYYRTLTFTDPRNVSGITEAYSRDFYAPFYNTDDFQLWSLNNPDKRIKDTWRTYKWPCKEIIYDFAKDPVYRDMKKKVGSLSSFIANKRAYKAIDTDFVLYPEFDVDRFFTPDNDFAAYERGAA